MKIGIIRCHEHANKCAGYNCFPAVVKRTGKFAAAGEGPQGEPGADRPDALELIGFDSCGGCARGTADRVVERAKKMRDRGAEVVYLGNCIVNGACPWSDLFCGAIGEQAGLTVVRGTH
jgi:predicted metal-binding protein